MATNQLAPSAAVSRRPLGGRSLVCMTDGRQVNLGRSLAREPAVFHLMMNTAALCLACCRQRGPGVQFLSIRKETGK